MNSLGSIFPALTAFVVSHPDLVLAALSYVVVGLINGLLPTKVDGAAVTRVLSTILDRLAPTTRADAHGTFKFPLVAASALRGVADVLDPKDPPDAPSGGAFCTPAPMPGARKDPPALSRWSLPSFALSALTFALSAGIVLAGCTPSPRPNGRYQPSGTLATIDGVARILGVVAPFLKPLVLAQIPASDVDGRRAAEISLTAFEGTTSAWLAARRTWDARGSAGYCDAYIATGALTSGLQDVIRTMGRAGVGMNPELNDLVNASGLLADRIAYCDPVFDAAVPDDADVDAQALLRSRSVAAALRATVEREIDAARDRGRPLAPLPPMSH